MGSSRGWEGVGFRDRLGFRLSSGPNSHNRSKLTLPGGLPGVSRNRDRKQRPGAQETCHRLLLPARLSVLTAIRCSELLQTQKASDLRNSHPNQRRPPFYQTPQHEAANLMHLTQGGF